MGLKSSVARVSGPWPGISHVVLSISQLATPRTHETKHKYWHSPPQKTNTLACISSNEYLYKHFTGNDMANSISQRLKLINGDTCLRSVSY